MQNAFFDNYTFVPYVNDSNCSKLGLFNSLSLPRHNLFLPEHFVRLNCWCSNPLPFLFFVCFPGILQRIHVFPVCDLLETALPLLLVRAAALMNHNKNSPHRQHDARSHSTNASGASASGGLRSHFSTSGSGTSGSGSSGSDLREATAIGSVGQTLAVRKLAACAALMDGKRGARLRRGGGVCRCYLCLLKSGRELIKERASAHAQVP